MELRQLVYFDAVVRHGGFTRAAHQLRIAQPAVSAQVKRLERELGVQLLRRTTRQVTLTLAGEQVLARARRVLDETAGIRADAARAAAVVTGQVRIGAIEAAPGLPAVLGEFHRRYPGVDLVLSSGRRAALLDDLDAGRIDLAVSTVADPLPDRFVVEVLFTEELVLVGVPGRAPVDDLGTLHDEPFACLPAGSGLRALLDGAAGRAGFVPLVRFEVATLAQVRELAAAGLGVALIARSAAEAAGPPVSVHRVLPRVERPVALVHRAARPLEPAVAALRELLLDR